MEYGKSSKLPENANYLFYKNEFRSRPDNILIEDLLKDWFYQYNTLESHHGFIQWLFPELNRVGSNPLAKALTKEEAKLIREDIVLAKRVLASYKLILNFYGLVLVDEKTGQVARNPENWKERYQNLMKNTHNHNRIRRIIRSIGQMGFARYRKPLVDHFATEIEKNGELQSCKWSLENLWKPALDVNSTAYIKETTETEEDRTDSVFFKTES